MGGYGSGRREGVRRDTVQDFRNIDIRRFQSDGPLVPGTSFSWQWTRDGALVAWINVRADVDAVELVYRQRRKCETGWQVVHQRVPIEWTPCHYGGSRPWFRCTGRSNGVSCGRRVAKIYSAGKKFACRSCYALSYQSQHDSRSERALSKCQAIRMRLGGSPSLFDSFPAKPKGMHWRTYDRLRTEAEYAECVSWVGVCHLLGIMLP